MNNAENVVLELIINQWAFTCMYSISTTISYDITPKKHTSTCTCTVYKYRYLWMFLFGPSSTKDIQVLLKMYMCTWPKVCLTTILPIIVYVHVCTSMLTIGTLIFLLKYLYIYEWRVWDVHVIVEDIIFIGSLFFYCECTTCTCIHVCFLIKDYAIYDHYASDDSEKASLRLQ